MSDASPLLSLTASANLAVPDRAIVPSELSISSRPMPTPVSSITMVRASASPRTRMRSSPVSLPSVIALKRALSSASEALDTSSRRKTSRLE